MARADDNRPVLLAAQESGFSGQQRGFKSRTGQFLADGKWQMAIGQRSSSLAIRHLPRAIRLFLQVGRRPVGSHKADLPGSSPGPATTGTWLMANGRWPEGISGQEPFAIRQRQTEYANRQSGQVESLVPVGSTPTSVTVSRGSGDGS